MPMRGAWYGCWPISTAKVNLIALNPGPGIPFETPDPERSRLSTDTAPERAVFRP